MDDETSQEMTSFDEINWRLGEPRKKLLEAFASHEKDQVGTSTLRQESEVSPNSVGHHLKQLDRWGLVTELEERRHSPHGGAPARQWTLTERGKEFIVLHVDVIEASDLQDLTERVVELEKEVEDLREQHHEDIDDLRSRMKQAIQNLKNHL